MVKPPTFTHLFPKFLLTIPFLTKQYAENAKKKIILKCRGPVVAK